MARRPISLSLRFSVFERDRRTCQYCGRSGPAVVLHIDHVMPVALGGDNRIDNLLTACSDCNVGKGARDPGLAMAARPLTPEEQRSVFLGNAMFWALHQFNTDAQTKAVMLALIEQTSRYTYNSSVFLLLGLASLATVPVHDTVAILRGLVAIGALRHVSAPAFGEWSMELVLSRARPFDGRHNWRLGSSGQIRFAPSVAEVHG